ncbi:caspase family protein [Methyloceanibacter sp.]|uniref:caspase family protein n=1 Tax=Methyloceanibacter sp. TaxID=1965321 RepID=UPI003D6CF22D
MALVIGIDKYGNLPEDKQLRNAVNDAEKLDQTLKGLGFKVDLVRNPTLDEMINSVGRLAEETELGDTVLFFFSGHGMRPDGANLLLPSDFPQISGDSPAVRERVRRSAFAEDDIVEKLRAKLVDSQTGQQQGLVLFVSDACRDNPFAKAVDNGTRSLVRISHGVEAKPAQGVFSIYSAGVGQTALDGLGGSDKNSVFMTEFAKYLPTPNRHLGDLMSEVKEEVAIKAQSVIDSDTGKPHVQVPAIYDETVSGRIFLAGRSITVEPTAPSPNAAPAPMPLPPVAKAPEPDNGEQAGELAYLDCVGKDDVDCFKRFMRDFPHHPKLPQAETLIRAKTELPRYQACVDGKSPSERLRLCELYIDAFPSGKYKDEAKTLRDQAMLDMRPAQPSVPPPPPPQAALPPEQQPEQFQPAPQSMSRLTDTDLFGGDIGANGIRWISVDQCEARCLADDNCKAYTYVQAKQWCWPKYTIVRTETKYGMVSGLKPGYSAPTSANAPSSFARIERFDDTDFEEGDIPGASQRPITREECETICRNDSSCRAYTWVRDKQWCWPKSELVTSRYKRGMFSGQKR